MASLSVVLVHGRGGAFVEYGALPKSQQSLPAFIAFAATRLGQESVLLFFVLSGFLVAGKLFDRVLTNQFQPQEYAADRISRIATPLIPALVFSYLVARIADFPTSWLQLIANVAGLLGSFSDVFAGNAPLWSLGFETWFYILAGSGATLLTAKRPGSVPLLLFLASAIVFSELGASFLLCWIIGGFAWRLRPHSGSKPITAFATLLIIVGVAATQLKSASNSIRGTAFSISEPTIRIILATGYALMLQQIVLLRSRSGLWNRLDLLGTHLAAGSYTLYLVHYPTLKLLTRLGFTKATELSIASVTRFGLEIAMTLVIGFVFYLMFEANTPLVKEQLRRWLRRTGDL